MGSIWVHLEVHLGPSGGSQENPPPQGPLWSPPGALWGCRGDSGQGPKAPKVGFLLSERSISKKRDFFRVNVFCSIAKHELVILINLGGEFDGVGGYILIDASGISFSHITVYIKNNE